MASLFKSIKFSPIKTQLIEDQVYELITKKVKSKCAKLLIGDALYIQPEEESDIDVLLESNLSNETVVQENSINVDLEPKSLEELAPKESPKETAKIELKTLEPTPEAPLPPKVPREEDKVPPKVYVPEKQTGDFDSQVMGALQETTVNPRAQPPDDFFLAYSDAAVCIPIFVLYLFVVVIIKTAGTIFNN